MSIKKSRKPSRKSSRKPRSMDAKILQKLKEIDREFKSMERFRLSMAKSRKKRIMKRIKKGEPADYKGYKKELTTRIKTHLSRVNKSIKAYSKILKKSRKPRKKKTGRKKSTKKSRKPRKKKSVRKKSKEKKMKMCGCGIDVHFRMKKIGEKSVMDKFYDQIVEALQICGIENKKIYHNRRYNLLSAVIAGQPSAKHRIFAKSWSKGDDKQSAFELIEAAPSKRTRKKAIAYFYRWLCDFAKEVKEWHLKETEAALSNLNVSSEKSDVADKFGNLAIKK